MRIGDGGRLVAAIAVNRGGHVTHRIRHHEGAPGLICHRGGCVAAAIRLREYHAVCCVTAGGGRRDTGGILLRAHDSTDRHGLSRDGTGGYRTVLHSFRASTILRPLSGSQAAFANKNRFILNRARKLRNQLLLRGAKRLTCGIIAGLSGDAEHAVRGGLHRVDHLRYWGIILGGGIAQRQHEPVLSVALFPARPVGCSWEHLHIQIRTDSRYEVLDAGKAVIIAWYENELGHLIGKKKSIMLERLPKFCRNGKGTQIYALLKSFAAHGGRDDASQYPNKNLANQVRKNLREYLCVLFGYSHSESPIEQETKNMYQTMFSISFSSKNYISAFNIQ